MNGELLFKYTIRVTASYHSNTRCQCQILEICLLASFSSFCSLLLTTEHRVCRWFNLISCTFRLLVLIHYITYIIHYHCLWRFSWPETVSTHLMTKKSHGNGISLECYVGFYNKEVYCFNSNTYLLIFILYWFKWRLVVEDLKLLILIYLIMIWL